MKQIKDFPNYLITLDGRVFSLYTMKFIKSRATNAGYHQIQLFNKGDYKYFSVHRLVADAYIPNPENKPQVNHMDGKKLNNLACNLEWMTASENQKHCSDSGLRIVSDKMRKAFSLNGKKCGAANGKKAHDKIILDEANGIYYIGAQEAANALGISRKKLYYRINYSPKSTTFKYV